MVTHAPASAPSAPSARAGPPGERPEDGPRRAAAVLRHWRALPVVATVLLLCLPGRWQEVAGGRAVLADAASSLLVPVAVLAVLCAAAGRARGPRPVLPRTAAAVAAASAVACAVATLAAGGTDGTGGGLAGLAGLARHWQVFVLVPLCVVLLLRTRAEALLVVGSLVVLAAAQGAVGAVQYATGTGASYMGENIRAVGTFGPQHVMGMATAVSLGLLAALCAALAPPPGARRWWRPAALGCAGLLTVPLALSFSRGAWLATAAAAGAVLLLAGGRARRVTAALACAGVLLTGGAALVSGQLGAGAASAPADNGEAGSVVDRIGSMVSVTGTPDQSVIDRYAMWAAALSMWRDEPWTGTGPKGFAAHRDSHASVALSGSSDTAGGGQEFRRQPLLSPHNMYLLVLSEQGLAGAAALVGGWSLLLAGCLGRLRRTTRPPGPGTAGTRDRDVGLVATGLLVWQTVNFLYADIGGPTTVLTAVTLGLAAWWALPRQGPEEPAGPPHARKAGT